MPQLEIELIPVLNDNYAYLVHDPKAGVTAVVDPPVVAPVLERLKARGWKLDWILSTHHHADHTGGNLALKQATGCRIAGPKADAARIPGIDLGLAENDRFQLGEAEAQVFETPGHTSGHISYWFADAKALFCADTLFSLGCGRLFEGTPALMWRSLGKFADLPDDAVVYCAHEYTQANARFALTVDPDNPALRARADEVERLRAAGQPTVPSMLGAERAANPFLRPHDPAIRKRLGMEGASDEQVFAEIRKRKDRF
ncbi:MAG TPA: hydroxyacylglutathione hydrolase [Geminicoccaceae bacterium]|nr:hydroxyacylglutathione hydrolase [Geminicoccaceae bacterium]